MGLGDDQKYCNRSSTNVRTLQQEASTFVAVVVSSVASPFCCNFRYFVSTNIYSVFHFSNDNKHYVAVCMLIIFLITRAVYFKEEKETKEVDNKRSKKKRKKCNTLCRVEE